MIVTALVVIAATATLFPVDRLDLLWFACLAGGAMLHVEWSRRNEQLRELAAEGVSYISLQAVWSFAGLLLLPPPLVAALIAVLYAHEWFRVYKRIVPHRWVFTASTVVLASACAGTVLVAVVPANYPGLTTEHLSLVAFAAVIAAGAIRWLVNYALVVGAIALSSPNMPARKAMGRLADQLIEVASLGFGAAVAALLVYQPAVVVLLLVPLLIMQRSLLASQLEHAAVTDAKTGLLNALYWHELAKKEMERARRLRTSMGILMIDVDRFKDVNRAHGQLAGDTVLRAVAKSVESGLRSDDLVARLAGEEFVALLPGVDGAELATLAERVCQRVRELEVEIDGENGPATVSGLTVSVGGSVYPDSAEDMDDLMLTADNALFSAKDAGRNSYCLVAPNATA